MPESLIVAVQCPARSPAVLLRYPLRYPDRPSEVAYVWPVPERNWRRAVKFMAEEPALQNLRLVHAENRTFDRLALFDAFDFGSQERRAAIARLYRLLMPPTVLRTLGLDRIVRLHGR